MVVLPAYARYTLRMPTVELYEDVAVVRGDGEAGTTDAATVVAGWFDGVVPVLEVQTGVAIALIFRVVCTAGPTPSLRNHTEIFADVRSELLRYRDECAERTTKPAVATVLAKHYTDFDPNSPLALDPQDMFRVFALRRIAPALGLRLYEVKMRLRCEGFPMLPGFDASQGLGLVDVFEMDDEELMMGKVTESRMFLSQWTDWTAGEGNRVDGFDVEHEGHRMSEDFSYWTPDYLQHPDYKVHQGQKLTQVVQRTALVVWPEEMHAQAVVNMCLMNPELATKFLDVRMWPAGQESSDARSELAATIYSKLSRMAGFSTGPKDTKARCMQQLLEYALTERKMELFAEFLQLSTGPRALNIQLHRQAQMAFGERWDRFIETQTKACMGRNALPTQIQIAHSFHERTGRLPELKAFLDKVLPQETFERLDPRQLHNMQYIRSDIFKSCVLPRLRNYSATQFWLNLEQNQEYHSHVSEILPLLAEEHVPYTGTGTPNVAVSVDLLVRCAKANLHHHSHTIVTRILSLSPSTDPTTSKSLQRYFSTLASTLATKLTAAGIPLETRPYATLFQESLLEYILPPLGIRPTPPPEPSKVPLPHSCHDCKMITNFLLSPAETSARWSLGLSAIQHLIDVLTPHLTPDRATFTFHQTTQSTGTLSVSKPSLLYREALAAWDSERSRLLDLTHSVPLGAYTSPILAALDTTGNGWTASSTASARAQKSGSLGSALSECESGDDCPSPRKRKFILLDLADMSNGHVTPPMTPGLKRPRSAMAVAAAKAQQQERAESLSPHASGLQTPRSGMGHVRRASEALAIEHLADIFRQ